MVKYARLPLIFDSAKLKADLETLGPDQWVPHFNTQYYDGDWSGASLRSLGGVSGKLFPDPTRSDYQDTPLMAMCPYFRLVASTFLCPLESIRLLRLSAGSEIKEHRDYGLTWEDDEFRVHIPVITNGHVEFYLENERLSLSEGECWYIDFNLDHRVANLGHTDRVHLVIDGKVNKWMADLVTQGAT